jgi:hypothetical protein
MSFYPWDVYDASNEWFVRVPATKVDNAPTDTAKMIAPFDAPSVRADRGQARVNLSGSLRAALQICDPDFRIWDEADSRELERAGNRGPQALGASALVGDFDGDLLPDVALLGRSGADQVVIAILSDHGRIEAIEVAWRRARMGEGPNKSRGDPKDVPSVYLELAPRGTMNPFCWSTYREATPVDAIGIVEPGMGRFDYVLDRDHFVLFAPVAENPKGRPPWSEPRTGCVQVDLERK